MSTPTPTHTAVQLLPCPFCGSEALLYPDGDIEGHTVLCSGNLDPGRRCRLATFEHDAEGDAIAAWNRRASIPAPQGEQPGPAKPGEIRFHPGTYSANSVVAAAWRVPLMATFLRIRVDDAQSALDWLEASRDSRTPTVAPGGQPLAQPNSQDGDSVLPPVEPPGATLSPAAGSLQDLGDAADLVDKLGQVRTKGEKLGLVLRYRNAVRAQLLEVDRGESSSEGGES